MSLPKPVPGLVIRFSFLWSHEAKRGIAEGRKDRPVAIVVATQTGPDGDIRTIVAPITLEPPADPSASIEIPNDVADALGLDGARDWLRLDELNRFTWPGYDLRPLPGRPGVFAYGRLPKTLYERLRSGILARQAARKRK
jgi:hypothetical protein